MKKVIIYILATMITFLSLPTNSYAEESLQMYATSNVKNIIQSNMYDDTPSYMFLFGTENVIFDFDSMLPVYYINDYNRQGTSELLTDIMIFSERYKVPVYNSSNAFLGFAEFGEIQSLNELSTELQNDPSYIEKCTEHMGEWEIKCFSEGNFENNLINELAKTETALLDNTVSYNEVFYVDIYPLQKSGLLYVDKNDIVSEQFCEVTNNQISNYSASETYASGTDILNQIISVIDYAEAVGGIWDDSGISDIDIYDYDEDIEVYEDYVTDEELSNDEIKDTVEEIVIVEDVSPTPPTKIEGNLGDGGIENPNTGNADIGVFTTLIGVSSLCALFLRKKSKK
ncbi:MAG: hypothetical protein LUI05_00215 [Oscillospiraceae bacterium]|nr:hypothetical protein [Oscillospiraceae bacterium]